MSRRTIFAGAALLGLAVVLGSCGDNATDSNDDGGGGGGNQHDTAGTTWTAAALPDSLFGFDVIWGGGKFVAVGLGGGAVSSDGITWTATTGFSATKVRFGNASYVAISAGVYDSYVWRSSDGVNWATAPFNCSAWNWKLYYLVFRSSTGFTIYGTHYPNYALIANSATGSSWEIGDSLPMEWICKTVAVNPSNASSLIQLYFDGIIRGVGYVDTLSPVSSALELNDVVYGNRWVIVADSGVVFSSADGTVWTRETTPVSGTIKDLRSVVWSGTLYVAVGDYGTILTSPNGSAWTQRTSGVTYGLGAVAWSGQKLVAIGSGGIVTSP